MSWSTRATTRAARAANNKYKFRRGLYWNENETAYSPGYKIRMKTIGTQPPIVQERQQLSRRLKKIKVTLPTIKEP